MRNRLEGYRPVGPLAKLCQQYQAPHYVQVQLARRAGTLFGTPQMPASKLEGEIHRSMADNHGVPKWDTVVNRVAGEVTDIYRSMRRA